MSKLDRVCRIASLFILCVGTQLPCQAQGPLGSGPLGSGPLPAGVIARTSLPTERAYDYAFTEVQVDQIEGWLRWVGYELPVDISGQVTGWLWAQRSSQSWLNFTDYRVEGELQSPRLLVDSWIIEQATLRFGYIDGVWYVGRLSGQLGKQTRDDQPVEAAIGQAELRAALAQAGPRVLQVAGRIDNILLQPLLEAFELGSDAGIAIESQPSSLVFRGQVPLAAAADIRQWNITADVALDGIRLLAANTSPQFSLTAPVSLDLGQWKVSQAQLGVAEQVFQVEAQGDLNAPGLPYVVTLAGEEVELAELITAFNSPNNRPDVGSSESLSLVRGLVSLDGQMTGSVSEGMKSATFDVQSAEVSAGEERFTAVRLLAKLPIEAGVPQGLTVHVQQAELAGGTLSGLVTWDSLAELALGVPAQADLDVARLELDRLASGRLPLALTGVADGQIRLRIEPLQPVRDWSGKLRLRIRDFVAADSPLGDAYLSASKDAADAQIKFSVRDANQTLSLQGACGLREQDADTLLNVHLTDYTITGELREYQSQIALPEPVDERFTTVSVAATGKFQLSGELENSQGGWGEAWPNRGSLELERLRLNLADQTYLLHDGLLNIQPDAWRIERFRLVSHQRLSNGQQLKPGGALDSTPQPQLSAGQVVGSALIRRDARGENLLNLRVAGLELAPYVVNFAPRDLRGLGGQFNIETRLKKPASEPLSTAGWLGHFSGQLRNSTFRDVPLSELGFSGELQPQRVVMNVDGSLFEGALDAQVDLPIRQLSRLLESGSVQQAVPPLDNSTVEYALQVTLKAAQLNRLMSTIFGPRAAVHYVGTADLEISARSSPTGGSPLVDASLKIPHFNFERKSLAQDLVATLRYRDGNLLIDNLGGGVAGGRITVAGTLREDAQGTLVGDLRFAAERLQLSAMTAWIVPDQVERYSGIFNYSGRALIGRQIQLTGAARLNDAMLSGYEVQSLRSHLSVWLARSGRLHEASTRSLSGTALGGAARGTARLHGDTRYEFSSDLQITHGKLDQLSRALGFEHIVGSGSFDAQAALRSNDAGRLEALSGPLRLDFQRGDAGAVPILADLSGVLPILQLSSTDINQGRLNAQFGQGQLRLQNFYLTSDAFWLVGNGTTSLSTGAMDISAVINTGGGIDTQLVQGASQKLIAAALPQLLLFTQLNDLVRNRTVYLRIGGRTSQPVIQPQVAPTLARGLLQNVRRSLLTTPISSAAMGVEQN